MSYFDQPTILQKVRNHIVLCAASLCCDLDHSRPDSSREGLGVFSSPLPRLYTRCTAFRTIKVSYLKCMPIIPGAKPTAYMLHADAS